MEELSKWLNTLDIGKVNDLVLNIIKFVNGGPVGWAVGAVVTVIVVGAIWYLRNWIKKFIFEDSQRQGAKTEAEVVQEEQQKNEELQEAEDKTDEVVAENPDTDKPHRPVPAETIED